MWFTAIKQAATFYSWFSSILRVLCGAFSPVEHPFYKAINLTWLLYFNLSDLVCCAYHCLIAHLATDKLISPQKPTTQPLKPYCTHALHFYLYQNLIHKPMTFTISSSNLTNSTVNLCTNHVLMNIFSWKCILILVIGHIFYLSKTQSIKIWY